MTAYDYVVVGGGTAGCVVAARLSEDPAAQVLLVETGSAIGPPAMHLPVGFPLIPATEIIWSRWTTPQTGTLSRRHHWPGGRVLGGSSSINAMMHVRGHRAVYDGWADNGAKGWSYAELLPYFRRTETAMGRDPALRGVIGPVWAAPTTQVDDASLTFLDALTEAGHDLTGDINGERQHGAFWCDLAGAGGRRQSAADAYLVPVLDRPNLHLATEAGVSRLLIERGRCTGVEYTSFGTVERAEARGEVILAAGTVGSAHLLLLSGIGPAAHLRDVGVPVLADLPGVGGNLHDHLQCPVVYEAGRQLTTSHGFSTVSALLHSGATAVPDVQVLLLDAPAGTADVVTPVSGHTVAFAHTAPVSRGTVRLRSPNPHRLPLIDPNYLAESGDLSAMLAALGIAREIGRMPAWRQWGALETAPGKGDDLVTYIRRNAESFYNPVGTCRIGMDDLAVVDPDLRVHGVGGLRVADASVMPSIPNTGVNATVLAVAERAADSIRRDVRRP
ncbi:MAG: GMC family oxidoreductase N-terminal domain-containing protein [Microbacterium sp.]|jgi:choline dehydrogenase|uniref:GMC family oxidoreductase n=1 Tax=Microbacterium sp. TaxID=51671 RepID=UPI001D936485|nr:GMC family oxidoreductase N-terminal domain-containing protein [Microbacterium sp.]MBW8761108.1 GMC family oxidoreductase N-terminal domain-containing protein [Microbacterium sp.]